MDIPIRATVYVQVKDDSDKDEAIGLMRHVKSAALTLIGKDMPGVNISEPDLFDPGFPTLSISARAAVSGHWPDTAFETIECIREDGPNAASPERQAGRTMSAEEFKAAITQLGYNQTEFAKALDLTPQTVSRWCTGARVAPLTMVLIIRLMQRFNFKPDDLATFSGLRP